MPDDQLLLEEAVELAHALVQWTAARNGIDVVFFKGPAANLQQLRNPRVSSDVDVFLRSGQLDPMIGLLGRLGWEVRDDHRDIVNDAVAHHSVTLFHPQWPCDIDLHYGYPGVEATESAFMSELLDVAEPLEFARVPSKVPGRPAHALLILLHALRKQPDAGKSPEAADLASRIAEEDVPDMVRFARRSNSLPASKPFFDHFFPHVDTSDWGTPSRDWLMHQHVTSPGATYLIALAEAPLKRKPLILFRGLFPEKQALDNQRSPLGEPQANLSIWWSRIVKFSGSISSTARDVLTYYRVRRQQGK